MAYTIDNNVLVEGPLTQVDDTPRYPLGYKVTDKNGRDYIYAKATADLTAGAQVKIVGYTAITLTSVANGGAVLASSTPSGATAKDLIGDALVVSGNAYPIVDGDGTFLVVPEVKATDTVTAFTGYPYALAGGAASSGDTKVVPVTAIANGKYGFVALNATAPASV